MTALTDPLGAFDGYFRALGYATERLDVWTFAARREADGDALTVFVPEAADAALSRDAVRGHMSAYAARPGAGRPLLLTAAPGSISTDLSADVRALGGARRTYAQLIDETHRRIRGAAAPVAAATDADTAAERDRFQDRYRSLGHLGDARPAPMRERSQREADATRKRVRQPFLVRQASQPLGPRFEGDDLLAALGPHLATPALDGPEVVFLIGNAGVGKTELFTGLYTYLSEAFQSAKERHRIAARPIAVTPQEIVNAASYSSEALFAAIAETPDIAVGTPELLQWRATAGHVILMFDGLDEFFVAQPDFFQILRQRYLRPNSRAKVVIVLRDSLVATAPAVTAFRDGLAQGDGAAVSMIELARWDQAPGQWREFAWIRATGRAPAPGDADPPEIARFVDGLAQTPALAEVAGLPFFLHVLWETRDPEGVPSDPLDALDRLVAEIVDREWEEKLAHRAEDKAAAVAEGAFAQGADQLYRLEWDLFRRFKRLSFVRIAERALGVYPLEGEDVASVDAYLTTMRRLDGRAGLQRLLETLAHRLRRGGGSVVAEQGMIEEVYGQDRARALGADDKERGLRILRQFALFEQAGENSVSFAQAPIADLLAARAAARQIGEDGSDAAIRQALGAPPGDDTGVFDLALRRAFQDQPTLLRTFDRLAPRASAPPGPRLQARSSAVRR